MAMRLNILLALAACHSARSSFLQGRRDPLQHKPDDSSSIIVKGKEKAGLIKMLTDLRRRPTTSTWKLENSTALYRDAMRRMLRISGDCSLCETSHEWLFIFGTGRSGSTTAMEMVNAIPGVYLAGENYGVMNTLLDMYKAHEPQLKAGKVSENNVLCALQLFVKTIIGEFNEGATKVIGFKEIRHYTGEQFRFFKKVFPSAKFIINTRRDLDRQHGSQFQVNIPLDDLKNWTAELTSFQASNPDDAFSLTLEDYSVQMFNKLMRFAGFRKCWFLTVAHANDGWRWNDDQDSAKKALSGNCTFHPWDKKRCEENRLESGGLRLMNTTMKFH